MNALSTIGLEPAPALLCAALLLVVSTLYVSCQESDTPESETPESETPEQHTNRLVHEKSIYLQQHAHNPVDWYPWGAEAFEQARRTNRPIFLSIGYSTCHWCHVMERESFENDEIAAYMNEHFVCIKVDREERPDVDSIYMSYVQARTGNGGWPMSVFLTPERVPFFGGTYYPPEDRYGRPGFMTVLKSLHGSWEQNHERIVAQSEQVTRHLEAASSSLLVEGELSHELLDAAVLQYEGHFDQRFGGSSGAPKFPAPMMLSLLLRHELRTGDQKALAMVQTTLDRMYEGGIYDHLGGGFSRYSVDAEWLVPHFEKMLYGNGLLAKLYAEAFQRTGEERYRRVARGILDYLLRDMLLEGGAFAAAEDADSEGEEGLFYTWTLDEIRAALAERSGAHADLAALAIRGYGATEGGDLDGRAVLHLSSERFRGGVDEDALEPAREHLFQVRAGRERPLRDDKVVTGWNGLAISAFAFCGRVFDDSRYLEAAQQAARFLLDELVKDGRLLRRFREGEARFDGQLKDYAYFVQALIDLYEADFDRHWLDAALRLNTGMLERFSDSGTGTFFDTPSDSEALLIRPRSATDGAIPSGTAVAVKNLLRLSELTMNPDLRERAETCLEAYAGSMRRSPMAFTELLNAVAMALEPPREVVFAGRRGSPDLEALVRAFYVRFRPHRVIAFADADASEGDQNGELAELLEGKLPVDERAAVYLCENYTCKAPLTDPAEVARR